MSLLLFYVLYVVARRLVCVGVVAVCLFDWKIGKCCFCLFFIIIVDLNRAHVFIGGGSLISRGPASSIAAGKIFSHCFCQFKMLKFGHCPITITWIKLRFWPPTELARLRSETRVAAGAGLGLPLAGGRLEVNWCLPVRFTGTDSIKTFQIGFSRSF